MLLKTLSLAGFKSFADRTRLTFDAGVNVVVGPNGSGKSNLLDALAWVMGTQATRSLRTHRMEDVIFAGTATRPALGRAEVSLTFENVDGFLPLDLAEITLTRRLLRDGTSEYELNGTPCRLLDIQELLSDGGVGRHQHVLVGQGQIGEILNARPDEHRAVIEEAAGVTKHRSRRDRSIRRLEQTAIDIDRLKDILDQERRRLRPLKRQANAALRYDDVKRAVRDLRLWLGGENLRTIRSRLETAGAERTDLEARISGAAADLEQLATALGSMRVAASEVGLALERDSAAAARLETLLERFGRIGMVARERRLSLESRLRGAHERRTDLQAEQEHLSAELDDLDRLETSAAELAERRELALQALEDEERALAEQVQLPAEGLLANLRGDLRALETATLRDERETEQLGKRRELVTARLAEETRTAEELVTWIRETDSAAAASQDAYRSARTAREVTQEEWETAEANHRDRSLELAEARARHEAITAALHGAGDPAAREMVAAAEGVTGALATRLGVPAELAAAVDSVLGSWSESFVAADAASVVRAATDLKSAGLGSVSLVVTPDDERPAPAREIASEWGVDALVDLLDGDRSLAAAFVGDVVVVEGWSAGWELVHRYPSIRALTPEGDVIDANGIRMASPDGAGPAALEAAGVAVEIAEREMARAESRRTTTRREFERLRAVEREKLEELEQLEARLAGHTEALALSERARSESAAEVARLDSRLGALDAAATARTERIIELRARVDELDGEEQKRQEAWEALNRRREAVARRRDEARRLREDAAAELASARERKRMTEQRLTAATGELRDLDTTPGDPAAIDRLGAVEEHARTTSEHVRAHLEVLRERQRRLRTEAADADRELDAAHQTQRELERTIAESKDRSGALAIELAELRVRDEAVAEGLRRDADATEEEALAAPQPDLDATSDPADTLATLEAQLRRMGPINPLAAAEYEELAAHVETLDTQLADLEESRSELRKVIAALDDEMSVMFRQAFEEISALYQENFGLVFPGGRGSLRLTDPDRPLETGVEIEAQPHGKKVGQLSLLSGGERSLAALAFLFAVFRARPSPFYVLDEVEAALDDANLRRFLRLVDTLRSASQLVIITHQQQTMEAADILYGVTMEPGESSLVVAKRFDRVAV